MTEPAAPKARPLRLILALVGVALVVVAALTWLNRRTLAREALTGWLRSKGIASEAEVYAIGPSSFAARLRVGDPARPDFSAARADVRYRFKGFGVEVLSVTLREPVLRASVKDGRLSVGSLDPLIEEFRKRPPRPDAARPRIVIDDGTLWLATDYGPVRLTADARVEDNKLMSLAAVADPARLRGRDLSAELGRATLAVTTRGPRTSARLEAPIAAAGAGELALRGGRLVLTADVPYPDLEKRRGEGAVTLSAVLTGERLSLGEQDLRGVEARASFVGSSRGWIPDLAVSGQATANLRAASGDVAGARARGVRLALASPDVRWTRAGGDRVSATLKATALVEQGRTADLTLTRATLSAAGPISAAKDGLRAALEGSLVGHGRYDGLGAPTAADTGDMVDIKRALRGFDIAAPAVQVTLAPDAAPAVRLPQPVVLRPDAGGQVRLASAGPDAWRLTAAGGGLPEVDATARDLAVADGAASAALTLKAALDLGPIQRGRIDAAGRLRIANGAVTLQGGRCATFAAEKLEFGENDVETLTTRLCPGREPLFRMAGGDWRIAGRAEAASANVPFLQAGVRDAAGPASLGLTGGRLDADVRIDRARVVDLAPETRFNPLALTGTARARRDAWTAELDLAAPDGGARVAHAALVHDGPTGQGRVDIDTGLLTFAEGGLQPAELSPMAAALGSPAAGQARFSGGFAWSPAAGISAGTLTAPRLDFQSPAGRVTGLSGALVFTSLAPLVAAPGQVVSVERLDAIVPVTGLKAQVGLRDDVLLITGGEAAVGGGRVQIESLELPLDPKATRKGVLVFEGVQLHDLVEASPFGDKVDFDARVTGRIPFEAVGERVRIRSGTMRAVEPGRLSIQREALMGVKTDPQQVLADGAPMPDQAQANAAITDFAYQAMENLAFNELEATLNSRDDGRMNVLFHIVGRHDPPKRQEIRLGLMDLIRRRFLDQPLPLPSGTGVNLTLDTTLNLDDLLADYAEYQRLRSSAPVQP